MSQIFRGTFNPQLQRYQITYSPTAGYMRNWDYKGFSESLMNNLMSTYTSQGCDVTLTGEHGVYSLAVNDSTGSTTLDTWQIQQQTKVLPRTENPRIIAALKTAFGGNDAAALAAQRALTVIARAIRDGTELAAAAESQNTDEGVSIYAAPTDSISIKLFNEMKRGITEFDMSIYVLRHTTNAPSAYFTPNIADTNVDCIYTTAQLLSETQNTGYWLLPLPPAMVTTINTIADNVAVPARTGYLNGWFKYGSSRSTAANFRIEICTEYHFGQHLLSDYSTI